MSKIKENSEIMKKIALELNKMKNNPKLDEIIKEAKRIAEIRRQDKRELSFLINNKRNTSLMEHSSTLKTINYFSNKKNMNFISSSNDQISTDTNFKIHILFLENMYV